MWRFMAPVFQENYKVVLFDHVGAGQSDITAHDREKYGRLDGYARDVVDLCQELDLSDVVFVGHSVSAMIGLRRSMLNRHTLPLVSAYSPAR